jgi:hypothetical protein
MFYIEIFWDFVLWLECKKDYLNRLENENKYSVESSLILRCANNLWYCIVVSVLSSSELVSSRVTSSEPAFIENEESRLAALWEELLSF